MIRAVGEMLSADTDPELVDDVMTVRALAELHDLIELLLEGCASF